MSTDKKTFKLEVTIKPHTNQQRGADAVEYYVGAWDERDIFRNLVSGECWQTPGENHERAVAMVVQDVIGLIQTHFGVDKS